MIGFTIFIFIIETYLSIRQLYKYKTTKHLPNELNNIITDKIFHETLNYGYDKLYFGTLEALIMFIEGIILCLLGYLPFLWDKSIYLCYKINICNNNNNSLYEEIMITIIFMILSTLHDTILSLPFGLYSTFMIEEKYGFNKTNLYTFFMDKLKMILLSFIIGGPKLTY